MPDRQETSILNIGVDRYVLRACQRHAAETVALCAPEPWDFGPTVPAEGVRILRADDVGNAESVLGALHRAGLGDHRFSAVHSGDEFALVTSGLLAQHLGCAGMDPLVALNFRDKALQKQRVREAGIATAASVVIEDIHDVRHLADTPFARSVLKPLSYGGTGFTATVSDYPGLAALSRDYRARQLDRRTFVLEEFMEGEEWIADGVVFEGEVLFFALGKYGEPCLDALTEQRPLWARAMDPDAESWAYDLAAPVVRESLAALGMSTGVFHMELFHNPATGQVSFGECAARRGGGLTEEQVLHKFNVDLSECGVLCALGKRPELDVKVRPGAVGHTHLLGRPGTIISYPSVDELQELPGVAYARYEHPFGSSLPDSVQFIGQSLGLMLITGDTDEELASRVTELRTYVDERLVVASPRMTFREHRDWYESHWPHHARLGGGVYEPPAV
ncbi:acetyl-CoA carboxylase biotin carboxylase subunit family protein [Streptomyces goshikiensis]|uniref:ATP-grasp domain-containing protein n=1 Tax=Streptomyces goshikiensis TaxID=1942 RepID=UPI003661742E